MQTLDMQRLMGTELPAVDVTVEPPQGLKNEPNNQENRGEKTFLLILCSSNLYLHKPLLLTEYIKY